MDRPFFESPASAIAHEEAPAVPAPRRGQWRILLATALLLGAILGGATLQRVPGEEEVAQVRADVARTAAREGRLVVVYFSGRNCPACVKMEHQSWTDKGVLELVEQAFLLWHLDPQDPSYRQLAGEYGVTDTPAVVITSAQGAILADDRGQQRRSRGYLSAEDLRRFLSSAQAGRTPEKPRTERATWRERKGDSRR